MVVKWILPTELHSPCPEGTFSAAYSKSGAGVVSASPKSLIAPATCEPEKVPADPPQFAGVNAPIGAVFCGEDGVHPDDSTSPHGSLLFALNCVAVGEVVSVASNDPM